MESLFLNFLELAPRTAKPRRNGSTIVSDKAYPTSWLRYMLDMYGSYVDGVKFTSACLYAPWRLIEERVKLYREYEINVALDDPTFAVAYYQGKSEQLLRTVREVGFTHVQIDTRHIDHRLKGNPQRAEEDEARLMALALDLKLRLEGEVGQTWPEGDWTRALGGLLNIEAIVAEMRRLLNAGCEHVYLESEVIRHAIGEYGEKSRGTEQIRQIVHAVGQEDIIIEVSGHLPVSTKRCHWFWAVRNFGPTVNLGFGSPIDDVPAIEGIRRGISFVKGPSRSTPRLWVKSLAENDGKASNEWWKGDYPIDLELERARVEER